MDIFNIFFVNKGHIISLNINVNSTTVSSLNHYIQSEIKLRVSDQILLDEKGGILDSNKVLSHYEGLGTESNPVFLFQKPGQDVSLDRDDVSYYLNLIDDCIKSTKAVLSLPNPSEIYMELPQQANECRKTAKTLLWTCARYVQEHQFLHQGWLALVHNLDDSVSKLQRSSQKHQSLMTKMAEITERAENLLTSFHEAIVHLKKIEVPFELINKQSTSIYVNSDRITLYEWITKADPTSTLEELANQVQDQLIKFKDHNVERTFNAINYVVKQSQNKEYRDISGINTRFAQLDHSLTTLETGNEHIEKIISRIAETPKEITEMKLRKLVDDYPVQFESVFTKLNDLRSVVKVFDKSKQELLENIGTRLSGFIVRSYEKLNFAHKEMLIYEEMCNGIRLRLDLIEQIKDSPILFSQSVSEVIRRSIFKTELEKWHSEVTEKCSNLSSEEAEMRKQYGKKIEKHFLRNLFPGMFCEVPAFYVKTLPPFDDQIPKIGMEYLSRLRQSIPELEQFLRVKSPDISSKLVYREGRNISGGGMVRREESFITREPLPNPHLSYSPAHWLSEDGGESSPVRSAILMRSPDSVLRESQVGIPIAPSLQKLDLLNNYDPGSSSIAKSAPIAIPTQGKTGPREPQPCSSEASSVRRYSSVTGHGSEQQIDQQFVVDDVNTNQNSLEFLPPMKLELASISKELRDVRAEIFGSEEKYRAEFLQVNEFLEKTLPQYVEKMSKDHNQEIEEYIGKVETLTKELNTSNEKVKMIEGELDAIKLASDEKDQKIKEINANVTSMEEKMKEMNARDDPEKLLKLEELAASKDVEINRLREEIEAKNKELEDFKKIQEEERQKFELDIKTDQEKKYKQRLESISNSVREQVREEYEEMRNLDLKNVESLTQDNKNLEQKLQSAMRMCSKLRSAVESVENGDELLKEVDDCVEVGMEASEYLPRLPSTVGMSQSCMSTSMSVTNEMEESVFGMCSSPKDRTLTQTSDVEVQRCENDRITCSTQTKICMPAMNMMVSVQDIKPGCTVLVIWDERHEAYILFCSSEYLHFVKESSVRRMNLLVPNGSEAPRRNWFLGKSVKIDTCVIKKEVNRYKLPVNTIVRRVEVDPVKIDAPMDEQI